MICNQFAACVQELKREEQTVHKGKKTSKRNRKVLSRENKTPVYSNYPCADEAQMSRCVCYMDHRSKPSCTERGKTYTLDHSEANIEVLCMHIDGGVVDEQNTPRCDYALFVQDKVAHGSGRAIFVELKGSGTEKALKQLINTLDLPQVCELEKAYKKVYGRIVNTSSAPKIQNTGLYMELKERLKLLGGNLKTDEWEFVERYSELDS